MTDIDSVSPLRIAILGTDTGVGKTHVVLALTTALRARGRRVWLHKPVACGGWADGHAEDARALLALRGDGQAAATICPHEMPEPASPHLAAAAAGVEFTMANLQAHLAACMTGDHDLVVEGVGGLLVPLTAQRETVGDYCAAARLPVVIVTRPALGTLNHTALTVQVARQLGLTIRGLVVSWSQPAQDTLAERTVLSELPQLTGLPILAVFPHRPHTMEAEGATQLAAALLGSTVSTNQNEPERSPGR